MSHGVKAPKKRPLQGRCLLTVTPLPSPPPHQTDTGTCKLKRFGRAAFDGTLTFNFAANPVTQTGDRTLTFRNGDVLRLTSFGTSSPGGPGLVNFQATLTVVGGTGRFKNATGQARGEGTANLVTRTTTLRIFDGWVTLNR